MGRSRWLYAALAALLPLLLWLGLRRARCPRRVRHAPLPPPAPPPVEGKASLPAPARRRRLALGAGALAALLALTVAAVLLVSAADGGPGPPSGAAAAVSEAPGGAPEAAVAPTPTLLPDPGPAPSPNPGPSSPEEPPAGVAPGGDTPIGPRGTAGSGSLPENTAASPRLLDLRDRLAQKIEDYRRQVGGIEVAIAVTDLQTGETVSVNGNVLQRTGCTINLFALLAAVSEFEAGRASPDRVAYSIRVGIGSSYPPEVRRFLDVVFGDFREGVARAQELMRSWGMEASVFDHVPYYGDGTQNNLLTALETNLVLGKLYRGELFSPEWTEYALARLREIKPGLNYMLPRLLPASATVAHKIGYYWDRDGWVNNDAGIVTFRGEDGEEKAYAITYLSQRAPTEYAGYSLASRLSRMVWDYFAEEYGAETSPAPPLPPPPPPPPPPAPALEPTPTPPPPPQTTPTPEPLPTPTPAPIPTPTPEPETTPEPTPEPLPSPTPESTPAPVPLPTPTPPPPPPPTPEPTLAPVPSPTPPGGGRR